MDLPIRGESPTRPTRFPVIPPVDVAAAIRPLVSIATAPTVSWPIVDGILNDLKELIQAGNEILKAITQTLTDC